MLKVVHLGKEYVLFDSIQVTTSLDSICGEFSITTTLQQNPPFGIGSYIVIKNEYDLVLISGFIEKMDGNITKDSARVTYSGRDILGDLVDSSVPPEISSIKGTLTLDVMCQKALTALGLSGRVINTADFIEPFDLEAITAVGFGGKLGDFLQTFARKRQLFLTSDGKGNLVIYTAPTTLGYEKKLTRESMLGRSFSFDTTKRFNKIVVGSEDNFSATDTASSVDRRSEFVDDEVRTSRYLQISAEETMNDAELEGKAKEEVSIRRAHGFAFSCIVPSHNYAKGRLIAIDDDLSGVTGNFLIRRVRYTSTSKEDVSELTICFPETYEALGVRTTKRKSKIGTGGSPTVANVPNVTSPLDGWTFRDGVRGVAL